MTLRFPLLAFLAVAACGAWPDVAETGGPPAPGSWPALLPSSDLYAEDASEIEGEEVAAEIEARAEALRRKATLLRAQVDDQEDFDALRARIAG